MLLRPVGIPGQVQTFFFLQRPLHILLLSAYFPQPSRLHFCYNGIGKIMSVTKAISRFRPFFFFQDQFTYSAHRWKILLKLLSKVLQIVKGYSSVTGTS